MKRAKGKTAASSSWSMEGPAADVTISTGDGGGEVRLVADSGESAIGSYAILTPSQARQVARQLAEAADVAEEGGR